MNKKVIITIRKDRYSPGVNRGKEFTAVDCRASSYGSGNPCNSQEEVDAAVLHCQTMIRNEGDIPVVDNKIETKSLGAWLE